MKNTHQRILLLLLVWLMLGACALLSPDQTAAPPEATATLVPEIAPTESSVSQSKAILLWLAPIFEPETPAGELLAARLAAFEIQNANVRINTRIKPITGAGGLVEALEAATVAAPSVVPDILTLAPNDLRHAAESALILPLPEDLVQSEDQGWYDYALPSSKYAGESYGMPFASEVDVLAYRIDQYPEPPRSWETLLAEPRTLLFPAADPRVRFVLAMYLGAGGELEDENGAPSLDIDVLERVLSMLVSARSSGVLPLAVRQYTSPLETWTELKANRSASAMTPLPDFLREGDPERLAAVALPTEAGQGMGLASTWSWAITPSDPTRQELILSLLTWLSEPEFVGALTHALGVLPTSQDALAAWPEGGDTALASSLVTITQSEPDISLRNSVNPAFLAAIEAVLGSNEEPALAAQQAVDLITGP